jgi:hypothetical protein
MRDVCATRAWSMMALNPLNRTRIDTACGAFLTWQSVFALVRSQQ